MEEEKSTPQVDGTENKKIKLSVGGVDIEAIVDKDGRIIVPKEAQNIMATGMAVIQKTGENADDNVTDLSSLSNDNVTDNFKGLPMRELIGGPLFAAAEAQEKLASIALEYYQHIAYEGTGDSKKTRLLEFELERPIVQEGIVSPENNKVTVKAPFIGLVPIPSLLIDRINVDFQMEVTETNNHKDQSEESLSTDISSKWFGVNVGISGKVSSSRENTRSTNQTAKYQVHVTASQQPQTEGLSKLMDIMASCIEPIPANK